MKRILVGFDGSAAAQTALSFAADLAGHYQAVLHVVAVAQPPEIGDDIETEALIERSESRARARLARARAQYPQLDLVTATMVGHPAEQLLRYAEENGIDHIVLGHRGRSFFDRWLLGSVSRRVVSYASCTVTITRPDDSAAGPDDGAVSAGNR